MVKVTKPGKANKASDVAQWWTKVPHVCGSCGTEYELEPGDAVRSYLRNGDTLVAQSECPTCGSVVVTERTKDAE